MANNPYVNKVIYGNQTIMDLTNDTVEPNKVLSGETFHDASGAQRTGSVVIPTVNDSTITIQRNGVTVDSFTLNQSNNKTINIIDDNWTSASQVVNEQVTFTGLDDTQGWGYDPRIWIDDNSTNLNPYCRINSITGAGTANMSITYDTDADNGAYVRLRIIK